LRGAGSGNGFDDAVFPDEVFHHIGRDEAVAYRKRLTVDSGCIAGRIVGSYAVSENEVARVILEEISWINLMKTLFQLDVPGITDYANSVTE
jgi:hypothetical protein